jgi:hypothetical protein
MPVTDTAIYSHAQHDKQTRVRASALQALHQLLANNDEANSIEHIDQIIPAILYNLSNNEHKDEEYSLANLAKICFVDLCHIVNIGNIARVMKSLLNFFDSKRWEPLEDSAFVLLEFANGCSKLSNGYNIYYEIICHGHAQKQFTEKIFRALCSVLLDTKLPIGPWEGIIRLLMQYFQTCGKSDQDTEQRYLKVIAAFCIRMPNSMDRFSFMINLCDLMRSTADFKMGIFYAKCILNCSKLLKDADADHQMTFIHSMQNPIYALVKAVDQQNNLNRGIRDLLICAIAFLLLNVKESDIKPKVEDVVQNFYSRKIDDFISKSVIGEWFRPITSVIDVPEICKAVRLLVYKDLSNLKFPLKDAKMYFQILCLLFCRNPENEFVNIASLILSILKIASEDLESHVSRYAVCLNFFYFSIRILAQINGKRQDFGVSCSRFENFICPFVHELYAKYSEFHWLPLDLNLSPLSGSTPHLTMMKSHVSEIFECLISSTDVQHDISSDLEWFAEYLRRGSLSHALSSGEPSVGSLSVARRSLSLKFANESPSPETRPNFLSEVGADAKLDPMIDSFSRLEDHVIKNDAYESDLLNAALNGDGDGELELGILDRRFPRLMGSGEY